MSKLYLLCGKIAAGKSTKAKELANQDLTILLSEDHWMSILFPNEINNLQDYVKYSARLRKAIAPHVNSLLSKGVSVVMDFPANTIEQRNWLRTLFETAQADHELHFIDLSDEICKKRLHNRNASGVHPYQVSDEQFDLFTSYFVPPDDSEGFNVILHHN
ncbi:ATP-binding protein [Terasakiella sp. A23]|uniref:AAA family ATPase n=1 Tax=Terasakiella sp. FCG-A23 TaxID=3080561 RepID=UPI0029544E5C|nr:ATP-binding protein [Terasakiella sp. A23]MDV7341412.1 ATP-binding protein [Terasakiella sp. A23]